MVVFPGVTADRRAAPHAHHLRVQRTARYYTLGGGSSRRATVWFVLHGYGQLAGEFIRYFADLATDDSLVVAPEAMNRFYLVSRRLGAGARSSGRRDVDDARRSRVGDRRLRRVSRRAVRRGRGDRRCATARRSTSIGFSQGAATATRWVTHGRVPRVATDSVGRAHAAGDRSFARAERRCATRASRSWSGTRDHYVDAAMVVGRGGAPRRGAGFRTT